MQRQEEAFLAKDSRFEIIDGQVSDNLKRVNEQLQAFSAELVGKFSPEPAG